MKTAAFSYDPAHHEYIDQDGVVLPHITGMLVQTGWVDDRWYTEESRQRGTAIHELTADYDLDAINPYQCSHVWKGYLLAYVKALQVLAHPTWSHIEEPMVSTRYRFGGTPDRVGKVVGLTAVVDLKTGAKERAHGVQLALQAILAAPEVNLPPGAIARFSIYLQDTGRFQVEHHTNKRDFDAAFAVIRRCCR